MPLGVKIANVSYTSESDHPNLEKHGLAWIVLGFAFRVRQVIFLGTLQI